VRDDWWIIAIAGLLILICCFFAVDCIGQPTTMAGVGTVQDRQWKAAWVETHVSTDSKGRAVVSTTYHPDEYYLLITFESHTDKYQVNAHRYGTARMSSPIEMWQTVGRLTGHRYLQAGDVISDGHGGGW
jgi:hypothetical protein